MRSVFKLVFYVIVLVLWLVVLVAVAELYMRHHMKKAEQHAADACAARIGEAYAQDKTVIAQTAATASAPPAGVKIDMPERATFKSLDETGRLQLAVQRQELILLCDTSGVVRTVYSISGESEVQELAKTVQVGKALNHSLPPEEGKDAMDTLRGMVSGAGGAWRRDYTLPLKNGKQCVFEWGFYPGMTDSDGTAAVAIFIRPSIYDVLWQKFRPHVYRNDEKEFWTNNYGYRANDIVVPKPAGMFRILCIGGSTTEEGPRNDLTYPAILERKLRGHFATDRIEVVNCGVSALNSDGEARNIADYLQAQPDLIVHYNFINDVGNHYSFLVMQEGNSKKMVDRLKRLLRKSFFCQRFFSTKMLPAESEWIQRLDSSTIANMRRICDAARSANISMAVCSFAYPAPQDPIEREYFNRTINNMTWGRVMNLDGYAWIMEIYNRRVQSLCKELGISYIPVAENLRGGTDLFTDICHMHQAGIERKADIVFNAIKDLVGARSGIAPAATK